MSGTTAYNGQIPTDPHTTLVLLLGIVWAAGQLTTEQAQALTAVGTLSELALLAFGALRSRR